MILFKYIIIIIIIIIFIIIINIIIIIIIIIITTPHRESPKGDEMFNNGRHWDIMENLEFKDFLSITTRNSPSRLKITSYETFSY